MLQLEARRVVAEGTERTISSQPSALGTHLVQVRAALGDVEPQPLPAAVVGRGRERQARLVGLVHLGEPPPRGSQHAVGDPCGQAVAGRVEEAGAEAGLVEAGARGLLGGGLLRAEGSRGFGLGATPWQAVYGQGVIMPLPPTAEGSRSADTSMIGRAELPAEKARARAACLAIQDAWRRACIAAWCGSDLFPSVLFSLLSLSSYPLHLPTPSPTHTCHALLHWQSSCSAQARRQSQGGDVDTFLSRLPQRAS